MFNLFSFYFRKHLNYEIIFLSNFIISVIVVVFCASSIEENDIYFLLHCDWCTYHHNKNRL